MTKNSEKYIIVFSILVVLYNVLVWAIPFPKNDVATSVPAGTLLNVGIKRGS